MIQRDAIEKDYVALFDDYGLGTTIWSPLASGVLTGKYNEEIPEDSRMSKDRFAFVFKQYFGDQAKEKTLKTLIGISEIAKKLGCSMAQLALAWAIKSKDVTTCLLGATKVS